MNFGICLHGLVAMRSEPSHKAEMVNQGLFGDLYRVLEKKEQWIRIQLIHDQYEGWIHTLQHTDLEEYEFLRLENEQTPVTLDLVQLLSRQSHQDLVPVVLGSSLPGLREGLFTIGRETFEYDGSVAEERPAGYMADAAMKDKIRENLTHNAMLYLNAPYLWGGRSPMGIDCSGLVQMAFKLEHLQLHRDASQQALQGELIGLLFEAAPGDLVFFDDPEGNIIHVGILINRSLVLHASGHVRIDPIDQEGIFHTELKRYTHKLRLIRRII